MKTLLSAVMACLLLGGPCLAAEPLRSGPQVNEELPGPFHPLNVTGDFAGEKACLYCMHGENPVAMIFARELTPAVSKLIKKFDDAVGKHTSQSMGGVVVFCSDREGLEKSLKDMAREARLEHVVLSIDNPAGPEGYKIARAAEVTVVLYVEHVVKASHAYRAGELTDREIDRVVADVKKIVK